MNWISFRLFFFYHHPLGFHDCNGLGKSKKKKTKWVFVMCVKIWINLFYSWIYFKLSMPLMMLHMQHTWFKSLLFPSVFVWKSLCIELLSISRVREWFYMKINKNKNDFTSIQLPVLIEFQRCPTPVWENDLKTCNATWFPILTKFPLNPVIHSLVCS